MVPESLVTAGFVVCGTFTVVLGVVHVFMPRLLDFDGAIPTEGPPLEPLVLPGITYSTKRSDVRGIAWIMNHAVSYALISIGVVDLLVGTWRSTWVAPYLPGWITGW